MIEENLRLEAITILNNARGRLFIYLLGEETNQKAEAVQIEEAEQTAVEVKEISSVKSVSSDTAPAMVSLLAEENHIMLN